MSAHTPLIRLQAAQNAHRLAQMQCPHWDCEHDGADHPCCYELDDAYRELRAAKRAAGRVQS